MGPVEALLASSGRPGDLVQLQLAAATERLREQRRSVRVLDQRAREVGVDEIRSFADLVPLLFSHASYKSYPDSFVSDGRWDRLSLWLDTVSAVDASAAEVSSVVDVDDWLRALHAAGIVVTASSGTSGKSSFLPMTTGDLERLREIAVTNFATRHRIAPRRQLPLTFFGPGKAPMRFALTYRFLSDAFGRSGLVRCLTDEPMRLADTVAAARLRKSIADGTASPGDIASFEAASRLRVDKARSSVEALTRHVLALRREPQLIFGSLGMIWDLVESGRAANIDDGAFHPGTVVMLGGGRKGLSLPDDCDAQIERFFGDVVFAKAYGMSELSAAFPMCAAGAYHNTSPFISLLVVDESGEKLLEPAVNGRVTGRVAAFDAMWDGRWGGVITGDRATVRFDDCECGAPGPTIEDSIVRYSELSAAGDDKLTCGATIDDYVRDVVRDVVHDG